MFDKEKQNGIPGGRKRKSVGGGKKATIWHRERERKGNGIGKRRKKKKKGGGGKRDSLDLLPRVRTVERKKSRVSRNLHTKKKKRKRGKILRKRHRDLNSLKGEKGRPAFEMKEKRKRKGRNRKGEIARALSRRKREKSLFYLCMKEGGGYV